MSLYQQYLNYLNQAMPDISGIFTLPQASMPMPQASMPIVEEETVAAPGLTPEQLRLLYPQDSGGGDDRYRGGGKFGNLDLSRSKTFTKDVYDEELGDFIPTELTAYYNPTLGNYQTFEGKNINPMFSNTGLTFGFGGGILDMLGLKPRTVGGYVPGSIRGFYDTPMDFFKRNKNKQERTAKQIAASKKASRQREAEAAFAAAGGDRQQQAMQAARDQQRIDRAYREDTGPGPGSYGPGGGSGVQSDGSYNDPFDPGGGE